MIQSFQRKASSFRPRGEYGPSRRIGTGGTPSPRAGSEAVRSSEDAYPSSRFGDGGTPTPRAGSEPEGRLPLEPDRRRSDLQRTDAYPSSRFGEKVRLTGRHSGQPIEWSEHPTSSISGKNSRNFTGALGRKNWKRNFKENFGRCRSPASQEVFKL